MPNWKSDIIGCLHVMSDIYNIQIKYCDHVNNYVHSAVVKSIDMFVYFSLQSMTCEIVYFATNPELSWFTMSIKYIIANDI